MTHASLTRQILIYDLAKQSFIMLRFVPINLHGGIEVTELIDEDEVFRGGMVGIQESGFDCFGIQFWNGHIHLSTAMDGRCWE